LYSALYVTVPKYVSHPSLVIYSFLNPTHKSETGTVNRCGITIANHRHQSIWWANQKHWAAVRSYLLHSFLQVHNVAAPFTSHRKLCNYGGAKTIFHEPNHHVLTFRHPILSCRIVYVLSTTRDDLCVWYLYFPNMWLVLCNVSYIYVED